MTGPGPSSGLTDDHTVGQRRRWPAWWLLLYILGGVAAAVLTCAIILASWHGCAEDREAGGNFAIFFLFVTALVVMPLMGAATGITAVAANALLRRIPSSSRLSAFIPVAITVVGVGILLCAMIGWIAEGVPPEGYCELRP
ncbi:hypothetical protein ABZV91_16565 [Nocardia sp. NPDC004568]|uniref:hypothetical protein n=1 Tax=Nocardia sp. NPDC004568 TaxID=3154551 RepID=UPI0033A0A8EF